MDTNIHETFLQLVRLGIGTSKDAKIPNEVDWVALKALADAQGLTAVVLDGLDRCHTDTTDSTDKMPQVLRLEWIGEVLQMEARSDAQNKAAEALGELFHNNYIRTFVLKGAVIAECYPKPEHRVSADMDCFLVNDNDNLDDNLDLNLNLNDNLDLNDWRAHEEAWKLGNDLVKAKGYEVGEGFYKNSSFHLPGLMVENHRYMTPFRGNKKLRNLEILLQGLMEGHTDSTENTDSSLNTNGDPSRIGDTWLYRPPVMVSALFLIEHAYSHFLHEGLTWRMVLDWVLFKKKHEKEICWMDFDALVEEFGFRKFYDTFNAIGQEVFNANLNDNDNREVDPKLKALMVEDIWAPLDLHESLQGVKAKFQLAGNYWRARWKYKYFTDMTWMRALMEWVLGAVFDRNPKLD